jgi:VCBS repeat-containing protein
MRKSLQRGIAVLSVVAVALAIALPVRAEEKAVKKAKAASDHQFTGTITAVDATAGTLTAKNKKEESKDFTCAADCKVHIALKEKATLADLKVGDKVTVKFVEKDGKNTAQKVTLTGEGKEKKEKKEKK